MHGDKGKKNRINGKRINDLNYKVSSITYRKNAWQGT
jgi:hypothetical protein